MCGMRPVSFTISASLCLCWLVLCVDSTLPAPTQDQDEVGEKQQLQLAKRLLTCPYFNQRLKVCVHALVWACMLLHLPAPSGRLGVAVDMALR